MNIMLITTTLICIFFAYKKYKDWYNPYIIFNTLWLTISILLHIGNKLVDKPNLAAYMCICTGVIFFNLSMVLPKFIWINKKQTFNVKKYEYKINTRRLLLLSYILLIISFFLVHNSIRLLINGKTFVDVINAYFTINENSYLLIYYISSYIIRPLKYVLIVFALVLLFNREENRWKIIINTLIIVILQTISDGGRTILVSIIFMFMCTSAIFSYNKKRSFKFKFLILFLSILFGYGILFLTNNRISFYAREMTLIQKIYNTIYLYFVGSITYIGKVIETNPDIIGSTKGVNFFAGIIAPFVAFLTFLDIISYPKILSIIGTYACAELRIGRVWFNALPTIFGYFYIDGGLFLTAIESIIFGYICKRFYINTKNNNLYYILLYILIFLQICLSSCRWLFYSPDYMFAFFYMIFFLKRVKNVYNKSKMRY